MATRLSDLRCDPKLQDDGRWVDYDDGVRLRLASIHSQAFQAARSRAIEEWADRHPGQSMSDEDARTAMTPVMARHILKDWDGVLGEDDQPLPYTVDRGIAVLGDPAFAPLRRFVDVQCIQERQYRVRRLKSDMGN